MTFKSSQLDLQAITPEQRFRLSNSFKLDLFFTGPHRTRWEAALMSLSPSWERCLISSSGPESWRPARSTARRPAEPTLLVMSCPGRRSHWSSMEGSPRSPLIPATKDWRRNPTPKAVASSLPHVLWHAHVKNCRRNGKCYFVMD